MKTSLNRLAAALLLGATLASGVAFADPDRAESGKRWEMMQEHRQERLEALKAALKLKPEQSAAWDAYAAALGKAMPGPEDWKAQRERMREMNALERHRAHVEQLEQRLAEMKTTGQALATLDDALDAEQKKTFDDFRWGSMHGRREKGWH